MTAPLCPLSFAAGLAEGRKQAALEIGTHLRQLGLDCMAGAYRGDLVLGNAAGPGSIPGAAQ